MENGHHEDPTARLAELLKHPDDLDKLPGLRGEFTRKKAAVDGQLKLGLNEQLKITQAGMSSITSAQTSVAQIKEEMMRIDRLASEAQSLIQDFPEINKLSVMQRNFAAVESMKASVDHFAQRLQEMQGLLEEDDANLEEQPNLLAVHEGISTLRDVRDEALEQVARGTEGDSGLELIDNLPLEDGVTLREYFGKLDEVVEWFDEHVGQACMSLIELVQSSNTGLIVRLALVIEEEERKDKQAKALQDAQREFSGVAQRFKSIHAGARELRGYKKKFLQCIESKASQQFDGVKNAFDEDPEKIEKACRWFFNDLNTVKLGMVELVPKRWKIFRTYVDIYHKLMRDFLVRELDDQSISPVHMLAILNWVPKYYSKLTRLGVSDHPETELHPHVIDDREQDLVREYRGLITKAVEEWMERMASADRRGFSDRQEDSLEHDADGLLHTKSLGDMWTMLREQLSVAQASGRPDVIEGVVDAMMRALKARQKMWENLLDAEYQRIDDLASQPNAVIADIEGVGTYQDWLIAVANDQITNIDDQPDQNITSFLTRFRADYEPIVSPSYPLTNAFEHESLQNGYIDLASHCMHQFASLLFATDFRSIIKTFFTATWYSEKAMQQITTTFDDYLSGDNSILTLLHPSLRDILIEELSTSLLTAYLTSIRNKSARFRRSDPFTDKLKDDVVTVFKCFSAYGDDLFSLVKDKWRVVNAFANLVTAEKGQGVVEAFVQLKREYWDVQLSWVEAVLRCRDDFDRGMLGGVKGAAAGLEVDRGVETVMSRVK
ncbi:exocyst complex component Sec6 [Teratosphaeria nubilosa]|uniref:Exocyst complex component Sec6 n=1 Tax=Teratosphaeria nubilosa TaxID=161662 RepID=A0A6G1L1K7_9PEZI|nr:exocyst complex component Sec6 [Teratosphaeria nubilosa]